MPPARQYEASITADGSLRVTSNGDEEILDRGAEANGDDPPAR